MVPRASVNGFRMAMRFRLKAAVDAAGNEPGSSRLGKARYATLAEMVGDGPAFLARPTTATVPTETLAGAEAA